MKLNKNKELDFIILMRFGPRIGRQFSYRWLTYAEIGKMINRSYSYVRNRVESYLASYAQQYGQKMSNPHLRLRMSRLRMSRNQMNKEKDEPPKWRRSRLTQQHLDYLTDPKTLIIMSGMTLEERCRFFHR